MEIDDPILMMDSQMQTLTFDQIITGYQTEDIIIHQLLADTKLDLPERDTISHLAAWLDIIEIMGGEPDLNILKTIMASYYYSSYSIHLLLDDPNYYLARLHGLDHELWIKFGAEKWSSYLLNKGIWTPGLALADEQHGWIYRYHERGNELMTYRLIVQQQDQSIDIQLITDELIYGVSYQPDGLCVLSHG